MDKDNYQDEIEEYSVKSFLSILIIIFFFFSLKVIKYRTDFLYNKYKINDFFIKIFGKINIFNTILIFLYYILFLF